MTERSQDQFNLAVARSVAALDRYAKGGQPSRVFVRELADRMESVGWQRLNAMERRDLRDSVDRLADRIDDLRV